MRDRSPSSTTHSDARRGERDACGGGSVLVIIPAKHVDILAAACPPLTVVVLDGAETAGVQLAHRAGVPLVVAALLYRIPGR